MPIFLERIQTLRLLTTCLCLSLGGSFLSIDSAAYDDSPPSNDISELSYLLKSWKNTLNSTSDYIPLACNTDALKNAWEVGSHQAFDHTRIAERFAVQGQESQDTSSSQEKFNFGGIELSIPCSEISKTQEKACCAQGYHAGRYYLAEKLDSQSENSVQSSCTGSYQLGKKIAELVMKNKKSGGAGTNQNMVCELIGVPNPQDVSLSCYALGYDKTIRELEVHTLKKYSSDRSNKIIVLPNLPSTDPSNSASGAQ